MVFGRLYRLRSRFYRPARWEKPRNIAASPCFLRGRGRDFSLISLSTGRRMTFLSDF